MYVYIYIYIYIYIYRAKYYTPDLANSGHHHELPDGRLQARVGRDTILCWYRHLQARVGRDTIQSW